MAPVPVGRIERQVAPPGPVWVKDSQTSSTRLLERMINRTTLSTQRVLHNHILARLVRAQQVLIRSLKEGLGELIGAGGGGGGGKGLLAKLNGRSSTELPGELGEQLRPSFSSPSPGPCPGPAQSPYSPSSKQLVGGPIESDRPWTEVFSELAEEEKERALQQQKETLQARFAEALSARERLEAELRQGQRVELLARFEQERAGLRARAERETGLAVEEACERLRAQVLREADEARRRETEAFQAEAQERLKERVREVEKRVRGECEAEAQRDRQTLQDRHTQELDQLHARIQQLEERLDCVTREKMQYEREFKKVQCSYRQFVDLTDSSLHSDYLLKLRRLGREPGLTEAEAQTDDIISVCPTPWPLSHRRVH